MLKVKYVRTQKFFFTNKVFIFLNEYSLDPKKRICKVSNNLIKETF